MLKTIERATRQRISIERLPTAADLRARRLELTRAALREILVDGDLERFRVAVETLADEFDLMDVALAAVKLAHEAGGAPTTTRRSPTPRSCRTTRDAPRDTAARTGPGARAARPPRA